MYLCKHSFQIVKNQTGESESGSNTELYEH